MFWKELHVPAVLGGTGLQKLGLRSEHRKGSFLGSRKSPRPGDRVLSWNRIRCVTLDESLQLSGSCFFAVRK